MPGVACPIDVCVDQMPPLGSILRAMAVYSKPEHIENVIKRCENHQKKRQFEIEPKNELSENELSHLVRCRHSKAIYQEEFSTMRQSVIVPYEKPQSNVTQYFI